MLTRGRKVLAGLLAVPCLAAADCNAAAASREGAPDALPRYAQYRSYGDWSGGREAPGPILGPQELRRVLRRSGFRNIDVLERRGRIYQVQVTDYRGRRYGLVVSARCGAVLRSYRIGK